MAWIGASDNNVDDLKMLTSSLYAVCCNINHRLDQKDSMALRETMENELDLLTVNTICDIGYSAISPFWRKRHNGTDRMLGNKCWFTQNACFDETSTLLQYQYFGKKDSKSLKLFWKVGAFIQNALSQSGSDLAAHRLHVEYAIALNEVVKINVEVLKIHTGSSR